MSRNETLQPGENDIDRREVVEIPDKPGTYRLQWSVRLADGRLVKRKTQVKARERETPRQTKNRTKRIARQACKELLDKTGATGSWTMRSPMSDYIKQVSKPAVNAAGLRPQTVVSYNHRLDLLAEGWRGYVIADAVRPRTIQKVLDEIAGLHGTATARYCRKAANKWVMRQLVFDEIIPYNPLQGMTIDVTVDNVAIHKPRGGKALTEEEWHQCVDFMLAIDCDDVKKRGAYTLKERRAQRHAIVEMCMLQAVTGLRIGEARLLDWDHIHTDKNGTTIEVTPEISKTHKGRFAAVLDSRVADRILSRPHTDPNGLVFPTPTYGRGAWDRQNCEKAINKFIREELSQVAPMLKGYGSHVWRSTLATIADQKGVSEAVNAAQFGHTPQVDRDYYNDTSNSADYVKKMMGND